MSPVISKLAVKRGRAEKAVALTAKSATIPAKASVCPVNKAAYLVSLQTPARNARVVLLNSSLPMETVVSASLIRAVTMLAGSLLI